MKLGLYLLSLYLMFCQYVCVCEIFLQKNKEFKTSLMTSFILLLKRPKTVPKKRKLDQNIDD